MISGAGYASTGVYWLGEARDWRVRDVEVVDGTAYGFRSSGYSGSAQQELFMWNCHAWNNGTANFLFTSSSYDHLLQGCVAHGGGHGFFLDTGTSSIQISDSRAEWTGLHGFAIYSGGRQQILGCVTDACGRTDGNGMYVQHEAANAGPLMIANCLLKRDGHAGGAGGRAGLRINGSSQGVLVNGVHVLRALDDGGTGIQKPAYGGHVTNSVALIGGCWFAGQTAGFLSDGRNTLRYSAGCHFDTAGAITYQPPTP